MIWWMLLLNVVMFGGLALDNYLRSKKPKPKPRWKGYGLPLWGSLTPDGRYYVQHKYRIRVFPEEESYRLRELARREGRAVCTIVYTVYIDGKEDHMLAEYAPLPNPYVRDGMIEQSLLEGDPKRRMVGEELA